MPTHPPSPEFRLDEHARGDGTIVLSVTGELDLFTAPELEDRLQALCARRAAVVLDLREVGFMDPAGLHAVLRTRQSPEQDGWSFSVLPQLSAPVSQLLDLTGARIFLTFGAGP